MPLLGSDMQRNSGPIWRSLHGSGPLGARGPGVPGGVAAVSARTAVLGDVATRGCHAAKSQAEGRAPNGITTAVAASMVVRPARCPPSQVPKFSAVVGRR